MLSIHVHDDPIPDAHKNGQTRGQSESKSDFILYFSPSIVKIIYQTIFIMYYVLDTRRAHTFFTSDTTYRLRIPNYKR